MDSPPANYLLSSRRIVVTGGASGIGAAIVKRLHSAGADGVILDVRREAEEHMPWPAVIADVTDERAVQSQIAELVRTGGPFDGFVAAAGVVPDWHSPANLDFEALDQTIAVNLKGFLTVTKALVPSMPDGSSIVAIGSLNSWRGDANLLSYAASKHAVVGAVRSAALSLGHRGIRVNAVGPGPVPTAALLSRVDARA